MHAVKLSRLAIALLFLSVIIIFITLILSCNKYTEKAATKEVNKAYINYPKVIAKIAKDAYPCIVVKKDTIITYTDSTYYVDCPDISSTTAADYLGPDTITITKTLPGKKIRVPIYLPSKIITITKYIEDSAKIFQLSDAIHTLTNEAAKLNEDKEKLEAKVAKKNKYLLYLLIALLASLGVNYLQHKRK